MNLKDNITLQNALKCTNIRTLNIECKLMNFVKYDHAVCKVFIDSFAKKLLCF